MRMPTVAEPDAMTAPIVALTSALVAVPSRAGVDPPGPVLEVVESWFRARGLAHRRLTAPDGAPLGLYAEVAGRAG